MNVKAIRVMKELLKKGMFTRTENPQLWNDLDDPAVLAELETLERELDFDVYRAGSRAYLIPNQENELFSQNNMDFRRDIKATNEVRLTDLYLLNYLAIYLLFVFFHGEGAEPLTRDFIGKDDFVEQFTKHCRQVTSADGEQAAQNYSINFMKLAEQWQAKLYGAPDDQKIDSKNGCLNRILTKMKKENLFVVENENIYPTQKCKDLMPYFLQKDRVGAIHAYLDGGNADAAD